MSAELHETDKRPEISDLVATRLRNGESPKDVFDFCDDFRDGYARVRHWYRWNWIDAEGNLLSPNRWYSFCGNFQDGFAEVKLNGKYNFIDRQGNIAFPNRWLDSCGFFHDGFAAVSLHDRWNFIGTKGGIISNIWFDRCGLFNEGYASVKINDKRYRLRRDGVLCGYNTKKPLRQQPMGESRERGKVRKTTIHLKESDLRNIIKESVRRLLVNS